MNKDNVMEKYGIEFPWTVRVSKYSEQHAYFDELIRQCAPDDETIVKGEIKPIFMKDIKNAFEKDINLMLFVHNSQFMFHPVYCLLLDIATPFEYGVEKCVVLRVSQKFKHNNFSDNVEGKFHDLLYSKENQHRLLKNGLKIYNIQHYEY